MTTLTETAVTTQVYRVWIKATPQAIWDAITKPEWTERYGYTNRADYDLRPGGSYKSYPSEAMKRGAEAMGYPMPDVVVDGEVLEVDPPNRLVQTFRMLMAPEAAPEGFTRLTYEIAEGKGGVSKLTVTHELEGAPNLALIVGGVDEAGAGGGWAWVLSDLKSLLETGAPMDMGDGLKQ
jgi:uncharacterized protein YndB with AHSA1/START domain